MKPRFALLVAAVLTTFVLVMVGAIVSRLAQPSPAELAAAADSGLTAIPTADAPATASARDALYQQQLAEAAERIAQANRQLEQAYGQTPVTDPPAQSQAPAANPPEAPPAAPGYPVSAEQAAALALAAAPGATRLAAPELVDFAGAIAYEVRLDRGLVYVDAASGAILANTAVAQQDPGPAAEPGLIGGEQAAAAARAYVGGGTVTEVKLEEEDGALAYEVRFDTGSRVYVDAYTGRVVYAKTEDRGDDHGHDDDDK